MLLSVFNMNPTYQIKQQFLTLQPMIGLSLLMFIMKKEIGKGKRPQIVASTKQKIFSVLINVKKTLSVKVKDTALFQGVREMLTVLIELMTSVL